MRSRRRREARHSLCGAEGGVERLLAVQVVNALHVVQVERVLAGDGAVEPGLQEGGPHLPPVARVALTDPADPGHHTLRGRGRGQKRDTGQRRKKRLEAEQSDTKLNGHK